MKKIIQYPQFLISVLLIVIVLSSCKKLYEVDQELEPTESQLYGDFYEYRSGMMGLYGLQQKLVEQLLVLGELRGDLLQVTPNADADLIEVYNFNITKSNKYASPINFFKLISACNRFIQILSEKHPEVLNKNAAIGKYDWFYGEAICMRAWAYFNAVRIYGKVPYIHESLSSYEEIMDYVNSPGEYVDSVYIIFNKDGYQNDTIIKDTTLVKKFLDLPMVVNIYTQQIEDQIKYQGGTYAVGYNYSRDNNDVSWEVTTWHPYSMFALLGHMYLTIGDYNKAVVNFEKITKNNTENRRYKIDNSFGLGSWRSIFSAIDNREHIYTIWFNKRYFQQNGLQDFFVNKFMMKPTYKAVSNWERCRMGQILEENTSNPKLSKMFFVGSPTGDAYRGYMTSFLYFNNSGGVVAFEDQLKMLDYKAKLDFRSANSIMDGYDTMVYKYLINKNEFDKDANYIIYRAAGIHLYLAEIFNYYVHNVDGVYRTNSRKLFGIINDGVSYYELNVGDFPKGVRGRVGLGNAGVYSGGTPLPNISRYFIDGISEKNRIFERDPNTNKLIPGVYKDYEGDIPGKQEYLEREILNERALELAFEGERFYDLMRIAKRRNDPSFLAKMVSEKFPSDRRQEIFTKLSDEKNWYINYFE